MAEDLTLNRDNRRDGIFGGFGDVDDSLLFFFLILVFLFTSCDNMFGGVDDSLLFFFLLLVILFCGDFF